MPVDSYPVAATQGDPVRVVGECVRAPLAQEPVR
jgi:hypothetical protein